MFRFLKETIKIHATTELYISVWLYVKELTNQCNSATAMAMADFEFT